MAYLRLAVGPLISAVCVAVLLTQIDVGLTWSALRHAHPGWLIAAVAFLLAAMVAKLYRWRLLFYPTVGLRLGNLASATYIGYMISTFVPMRLGEFVRAYLITRTEPVAFSQSVGTLLVEKVLDVVTILVFLAGLGLFGLLPELAVPGPALAAMGLVPLAGLLILAGLPRETVLGLLARAQPYLPGARRWPLVKLVGPFLDALGVLRYRQLLPELVGWSLATWLSGALINYAVLRAFELPAPLAAAVFVMIVTNLGAVVPSAPGYVGVFEGLTVVALAAYSIDANQALGYALSLHLLIYGSFVAGGLLFLWRGGYRLADLRVARGSPVSDRAKPTTDEDTRGAAQPST